MTVTVGSTTAQGRSHFDFVPDLSFHRAIPVSASNAPAISITVGGIRVQLLGLSADQAIALRERFGIFFSSEATPVRSFLFDVCTVSNEAFLATHGTPSELYRINIAAESGAVLATSHEWSCWFSQEEGRGGLVLTAVTSRDPRAFDRAVENFLRVLYSHALLDENAFLLHAAGLVRDGRAYLFFGPSGSGKTTVTTMSPEATVLSDDLTLVKVVQEKENGESGRLVCYSSSVPFRGVFAPRPERETLYPVAGFFRLVQDTTDHLVPLSGARAVGEIVASLPFVTERHDLAGRAIDVVSKAVIPETGTPVFQLHFRKDRTFWNAIAPDGGAA